MSRSTHTVSPVQPQVQSTLRKFKEKVASLSPEERRFATSAMVAAPIVEVCLRVAGLKRTLALVERWIPEDDSPRSGEREVIAPERAAALIDAVYRLQPLRGRCLPRALLQYGLQRRRGAAVRFVVGVRKEPGRSQTNRSPSNNRSDESPSLDAHAWVEAIAPGGDTQPGDFVPILTRVGS